MRLMLVMVGIAFAIGYFFPGDIWARDVSGKWAQASPKEREWFRKQKQPKTGSLCCSEADGDQVDEEIRYGADGIGRYWINSVHTHGKWLEVPESAVIEGPNPHGRAVAWFRWKGDDGTFSTAPRSDLPVEVFCFAPGPLL